MTAGSHDITIEQGATFRLSLIWREPTVNEVAGDPIDLTGYTARMQVRRKHTSDTTILSLTSAAGDITLGGAAGTIVVVATAAATAAIDTDNKTLSAVYDLELINGSTVTRLLEGSVTITPEVTR